jgi:aspartyl-tRNA(Asn)/glutamyl-tRNA(Gln) amidotransferase subunit B
VVNKTAVELALRLGAALGCEINLVSEFSRKSYFYPDLPKGYQISQYDLPLCEGGVVAADGLDVPLNRMHLEEDAGKSIHNERGDTLLDMNRCGVPLLEIVSMPAIAGPGEAAACLIALRQIMQYLDVCDGDMEKGELRCDVNVSVRRRGEKSMGEKAEIKNLNSFRAVERSLRYEIERQAGLLERGLPVRAETLLWDEERERCEVMRSKEDAQDYRYFPEPDLPRLAVDEACLRRIEESSPELPSARRRRFVDEYGITAHDAVELTVTRDMADYYEGCVSAGAGSKAAANWVMTEVRRWLKEKDTGLAQLKVRPRSLAGLLALVADGSISHSIARGVFEEMAETGVEGESIVKRKGLSQISDRGIIGEAVGAVLRRERRAVEQYRAGKMEALEYLVGAVMKQMSGAADPHVVRAMMAEELESGRSGQDRRSGE